jgi:hypothetical protein
MNRSDDFDSGGEYVGRSCHNAIKEADRNAAGNPK